MSTGLASIAGAIATLLFVTSTLPMLTKAVRTKDLTSYSGSNLAVANMGNLTQTLYLTTVPSLPIWALHLFNTLASASMLALWIRHRPREGTGPWDSHPSPLPMPRTACSSRPRGSSRRSHPPTESEFS